MDKQKIEKLVREYMQENDKFTLEYLDKNELFEDYAKEFSKTLVIASRIFVESFKVFYNNILKYFNSNKDNNE